MGELFATSNAFRAARDSWWASRSAKRDAITGQLAPAARKAAAKERRWFVSGERYLRAYRSLDGGLIRVPPELVQLTERLIEDVAPKLGRAFDKRLGRVAIDAWAEWPVGTGLSKSLIDVGYEQKENTFAGRVVSRAPYTVFIHKGKAFRELIKAPGLAAARQILTDLADSDVGGGRGV